MNGRGEQLRSLRARADQNLYFAGLEHELEIETQKAQFMRFDR